MKALTLALAFACGLMAQAPFQTKVTGHGRPMILIPGLSCPGEVWDGTVDHFKNRFEMHILSLAGFARIRLYFGAERPLIRRSLNALEEQLDPAMFFRAGRKEILNLKWIEKVDLSVSGGFVVTLRGGRTVEMSRRQSARFKEMMSL